MKRLVVELLIGVLALQITALPILARSNSSFKSYSKSSFTKSNSNPKYIVPRKQIPVPKTQTVKPYIKKNGTFVPGYQRAPKNSLKPWHNPTYQKK